MMRGFVNEEAAQRSGERVSFSFGENWRKYLDGLTEERVAHAESSLRKSFGGAAIPGQHFVDIGCGSGLFSLCALRMGAGKVTSIDVDPASIACAEALRSASGRPGHWDIRMGSVLDRAFLQTVEPGARIYSWGVLHHTGAMWAAIENVFSLVGPGGLFCLALYNRPYLAGAQMALKRLYNLLPRPLKPVLASAYAGGLLGAIALTGRNPAGYARDYGRRARGMSFWRDVEDWLGGLPFEFTSEETLRPFVEARGFAVETVVVARPGGNNEYLLRKVA